MGRVALGVWLVLLTGAPQLPATSAHFGFQDVYAQAQRLAERPYEAPQTRVPPFVRQLHYDQYRDIRYRPDRALWRDLGLLFQVQLFHPGYLFDRPVAINVIDALGVHRVPFSPDLFNYGQTGPPSSVPTTLGFAGFRLHYPINASRVDEFAVFLGASYFRAIGQGELYGLSARGIAVNTAEPVGEEFPAFTEFWLRTPGASARSVTIYALLDGPSVAGAYQFVVAPGAPTRMDVTAAVFLRKPVARLGVAPLSSMYFHGPTTLRSFRDFRPEVHDSDGLLIAAGDREWLWRPLTNPDAIRVSSFPLSGPRGFGLMQRERTFDHYQDLEARYDIRPSAWVVPDEYWPRGEVRLIEFPSEKEYSDNIVAMWVPAELPPPGTPLRLAYHVLWGAGDRTLPPPPGARTVATRIGETRSAAGAQGGPVKLFVLDFAGGALDALPPTAFVDAVTTVEPGATIEEQHVQRNPISRTWRVSFRLQFTGKSPVEVRCFLSHNSDVLTETWSYVTGP